MLFATLRYCLFLPLLLLALRTAGQVPYGAPAPTLEFVENRGQWDARAHYAAALPAGRLFVAPTGFTYAFLSPAALGAHHAHTAAASDRLPAHAYSVTFEGASAQAALLPEQPTTEHRNYFVGNDARRWARDVRSFRRLRLTGLYPGIDAQLYENAAQQLEYDFTVQPGARPEQLRLRYAGADQLTLHDGNLVISTSVGFVTEQAPRAWQLRGTERVPVACAFELRGQVVSFRLGRYNHRQPLIIDPTVIFSSFTGASGDNWGFTATYDPQGNLYSGGIALATGYPVSPGAYDVSFNGSIDMAIIKYNPAVSGSAARLYATYLGGSGTECPHSLVVDGQGNLVVLGTTSSANYPVTATAYDPSFNGGPSITPLNGIDYRSGSDLVITKLSPTGAALVASTFLGGTGTDGLLTGASSTSSGGLVQNYGDQFRGDLITDGSGNVYVASSTTSANFPVPNGYQTTYRGGTEAIVSKLSADLSRLEWSTFLGSAANDAAYSIQLDAARTVYVCGGTEGAAFPTTPGSFHPASGGGTDGFVAHLSADGRTLLQATYLGTASLDQAYFLQLDAAGSVYVLGQSFGTYPATPGRYVVPGARQFIQKLNGTLSTGIYATTFGVGPVNGAAPRLSPTAFLVDDCERLYVCGWGGVVNYNNTLGMAGFPVTNNAIQRTSDGSDFYLAQFTPDMQGLEYATFFGEAGGLSGEHVDGGTSRFDKRGLVYQAVCGGCGGSSGFPVPPGVNTYSSHNGSTNCNNAAFKIDFGQTFADPGPSRYVCVGSGPVALGGTPAGGTWTGPGVTARPGGGYQFTPAPALLGVNILTYSVATTGICISRRPLRLTVTPEVPVAFTPLPATCIDGAALTLAATPPGGTFSGPGVSGNRFSPAAAGVGTFTLLYTLADTVSCGAATQTVVVRALPVVEAGPDTTLCADQRQPFQLRGAMPAGGTWSGPGVSPTGLFTPPDTKNKGANLIVRYLVSADGCTNSDTRKIVLAPTPTTNEPLDVPECPAAPEYTGLAPFTVTFAPILPGGTYHWDFGDGGTADEAGPTHTFTQPGTYPISLTARYASCVVVTQFAAVRVGEVFVPNIITPNGDSLNEAFHPRFSCRPARLQVFNRWGTEVYRTASYHNDWRGAGLPDGVYYYYLLDADGRKARGWVEVKR